MLNTRVPTGVTGGLLADSLVLMACGGSKGSKPDAKQLTGKIVGSQTADISHMQHDALTSRRRPASAPFVVRDEDDGRAGVKRLLSSVRTELATPSLYRLVYDRAVL